jgi:hypothetical protein
MKSRVRIIVASAVMCAGMALACRGHAQQGAYGQPNAPTLAQATGALRTPGQVGTPGSPYLTLPSLAPQANSLSVLSLQPLNYGVFNGGADPRAQNPLVIVNAPLAPMSVINVPLATAGTAGMAAPVQSPGTVLTTPAGLIPPTGPSGIVQMPVHALSPLAYADNSLTTLGLSTLTFGMAQPVVAPAPVRSGLLDVITPQYVQPAANLADWQTRILEGGSQAGTQAGQSGVLTTFFLPSRVIPIGPAAPGGVAGVGNAPPPAPLASLFFNALTTPFAGFDPLALVNSSIAAPNLGPVLGPRF